MQEPIVSEELFDRVQKLRSHKRRNTKTGRGTCNIHYIRNVVLKQIVAGAVGSLADFVRRIQAIDKAIKGLV